MHVLIRFRKCLVHSWSSLLCRRSIRITVTSSKVCKWILPIRLHLHQWCQQPFTTFRKQQLFTTNNSFLLLWSCKQSCLLKPVSSISMRYFINANTIIFPDSLIIVQRHFSQLYENDKWFWNLIILCYKLFIYISVNY